MLRLTVSAEEYLMIGDDIKIVFLGGSKNHLRIMVDAPRKNKHIIITGDNRKTARKPHDMRAAGQSTEKQGQKFTC